MPRKYESTEALCPFYIGEDPKTIYCEGVLPGTQTALILRNAAKDYKFAFCRGKWWECRLACMLAETHEEN